MEEEGYGRTNSLPKITTDDTGEIKPDQIENNVEDRRTSHEVAIEDSGSVSSAVVRREEQDVAVDGEDNAQQDTHTTENNAQQEALTVDKIANQEPKSTDGDATAEDPSSSDIAKTKLNFIEDNSIPEAPTTDEMEQIDIDDDNTIHYTLRSEGYLSNPENLSLLDYDTKSDESRTKALSKESLSIRGSGDIRTFMSSDDMKELSIRSMKTFETKTSSEDEITVNDNELQTHPRESTFKRTELIDQCRNLLIERRQLRRKNILLQKKLFDYFKKKKAEGTYREGESIIGALGGAQAELHYRKNLLVFEDVQNKEAYERAKIEFESKEIMEKKNKVLDEAIAQVDLLLKQEETFGHGLIDSQTGTVLSEKVTLHLINRQRLITKHLTETMLKYIRVRDEVAEKETALKALEVLGEGLHLIDYEQLRVESRALNDKIEERDNELSRLREKIETSILALSHIHEKGYDTDQLMNDNIDRLNSLTCKVRESRGKRTKAKKRLIHVRGEIERLQHEAGLLTHHSLLRDFENVLIQAAKAEVEVSQMKKNFIREKNIHFTNDNELNASEQPSNETTTVTINLARKPSTYSDKRMTPKHSSIKKRGKKHGEHSSSPVRSENLQPKLYKGRPSIVRFLPQAD